jgi:hypothetical protein
MANADETVRRIYDDSVQWLPWDLVKNAQWWDYAVFRFPFVPGFHLCFMENDGDTLGGTHETIISTHKTLHEAMGLCRLLLANGGVHGDA